MSDYYDMEKPYKIKDWNLLVTDVNEILENPPEGSDCEPVEPLEEVEDPHRWAVKDIEDMRDALIETCPEISFEKDLIIWKAEIIDEIEAEMEKAWCDCAFTAACTDLDYTVSNGTIEAISDENQCCGATYYNWNNVFCPEIWSLETVYTSPKYPLNKDNNTAKDASYSAKYDIAWEKSREFARKWDELIQLKQDINDKQVEVTVEVREVDAAISDYKDCVAECAALKAAICPPGERAKELTTELEELLNDFETVDGERQAAQKAADEGATDALAIIMSYQIDRPGNENLSAPLAEFLSTGNVVWADLIDPRSNNVVKQVMRYEWAPTVSNQVVPKCDVYKWTYYGQLGKLFLRAEITPGGNPYWASVGIITDVINSYALKTITWSCDNWPGAYCSCGVIACDLCPPEYLAGGGLWFGMDDLDYYIETTMKPPNGLTGKMCVTKGTSKVEEQETFFDEYLNWFDHHEKYDDRHEEYC